MQILSMAVSLRGYCRQKMSTMNENPVYNCKGEFSPKECASMESSTTNAKDELKIAGLLLRPTQTLQQLPLEFRWEVTRRHPYYQLFWQNAHRFRAEELNDPKDHVIGQMAVTILMRIGVTGDPPPPTASWESLQSGDLLSAWQDGALAPLTYRAMAGVLLTSLPAETRKSLAELLIKSTTSNDDPQHHPFGLVLELMTKTDPILDCMPTRPIVGVNVFAPQRALVTAIEKLAKEWKQIAGINEQRRRDDSLQDYLRAWDLREGWIDGHYDIHRELTFQQIADKLSISKRTAASRCYSAFRLIIGHDYSFGNWIKLFMGIKLTLNDGAKSLRRRKQTAGSRRSIPQPSDDSSTNAANPAIESGEPDAGPADVDSADLGDAADHFIDIAGLVDRGWPDDEILEEMQFENPKSALEVIKYIRARRQDTTS
jgi:hypothetical protein